MAIFFSKNREFEKEYSLRYDGNSPQKQSLP
jgi:hypothetical protein